MSELYSYYLKVDGSEQDQQTVFNMLKEKGILDEYLSPVSGDLGYYADYKVFTYEWEEEAHDATLHEIALKVPNAIITLEAESKENDYAFDKQYKGNLFRRVVLKSHMPRITEQEFTTFENRFNAPVTPTIPEEYKVKNVYILCECFEDSEGIRYTNILNVGTNENSIREKLQNLIEEDPMDFIKFNGIEEITEDYLLTKEKNGCWLEYYISEQPLSYDAPARVHNQEKETTKTPLEALIKTASENIKSTQLHSDKALQR